MNRHFRKDYSFFYNTARHAAQTDCALIVSKNIDEFPDQKDAMQGNLKILAKYVNLTNI